MPAIPSTRDKTVRIGKMFEAIAPGYDRMNRLITLGRDRAWRRYVVQRAEVPPCGRLLDAGTGTGMIAREALRNDPSVTVLALDFSLRMMQHGRKNAGEEQLLWCRGDAMRLPLPDASVDAVTSGYLLRNIEDVRQALEEQVRVVKPEGRVVCLETTPPPPGPMRPLILLHMKVLIPLLGTIIAGNGEAYRYLPDSTRSFMGPNALKRIMRDTGLENVSHRCFMFGTQMVCFGTRPGLR